MRSIKRSATAWSRPAGCRCQADAPRRTHLVILVIHLRLRGMRGWVLISPWCCGADAHEQLESPRARLFVHDQYILAAGGKALRRGEFETPGWLAVGTFRIAISDGSMLEPPWHTLQPSGCFCSQGDTGDAFYIVMQGTVVVSKDGKTLVMLNPGADFGADALDKDSRGRRTATVTAGKEKCVLAKLSKEAYLGVTGDEEHWQDLNKMVHLFTDEMSCMAYKQFSLRVYELVETGLSGPTHLTSYSHCIYLHLPKTHVRGLAVLL